MLQVSNNRNFIKACFNFLLLSKKKCFISIYKQNKYVVNESVSFCGLKNVGIVFQGPVLKKDSFTIESILQLRRLYPDIVIVLSTWEGSLSSEEKDILRMNSCHIIESKPYGEEYKGQGEKIGHINNQILSSRIGINYLYNNRIEYAMKIRSDLRIYRKDFIPYLLNIDKLYKTNDNKVISVAFSNSLYNVPFHLSDFIWFGRTDELKRMYSIKIRTEDELKFIQHYVDSENFDSYKKTIIQLNSYKFSLDTSWFNEYQSKIPTDFLLTYHEEGYLFYNYCKLKFLGDNDYIHSNILELYYKALSKIVIIDDYDLQVYWGKGEYSIIQNDYSSNIDKRLSHSKWLDIYLNNSTNKTI